MALASAGLSWQTEGKRQLTEAAHSAQLSVHTGATPGTYWWPQAGCPGGGVFKLHFAIGSYLRSVLFFFLKKKQNQKHSVKHVQWKWRMCWPRLWLWGAGGAPRGPGGTRAWAPHSAAPVTVLEPPSLSPRRLWERGAHRGRVHPMSEVSSSLLHGVPWGGGVHLFNYLAN